MPSAYGRGALSNAVICPVPLAEKRRILWLSGNPMPEAF